MRIMETFNGTGATLYLCIGFIPDYVRVWNLEGTQRILAEWNKGMMGCLEVVEGIQLTAADQTAAALTKGTGILPYFGGTVLTTTTAGTTTYAEGVYLKADHKDYRWVTADSPHGVGDAISQTIDTWALGSSTNYTGNFNADVTGTYMGEGSPICIDGRWYTIVALTASQGISANEVTLSHAVNSGAVEYIGGMYSTIPMISGEVTRDGFVLTNTTVNVNDARCCFEAGTYDR